jgi:hypothetical protein
MSFKKRIRYLKAHDNYKPDVLDSCSGSEDEEIESFNIESLESKRKALFHILKTNVLFVVDSKRVLMMTRLIDAFTPAMHIQWAIWYYFFFFCLDWFFFSLTSFFEFE